VGVWGWGQAPEAERLFLFQIVIVALKRGGVATISVRYKGEGEFKGWGAAVPRSPNLQGRGGGRKGAAVPSTLPWIRYYYQERAYNSVAAPYINFIKLVIFCLEQPFI